MMNRTGWLLLCAPLATAGLLVPIVTGGCQSDSSGGGGSGNAGLTTTTTTHQGGGGGTGGTGNGGGATGGNGGAPSTCGENATAATVQDITTGVVGAGVTVHLTGAVVMSQKFFVSKGSTSGTCLWGVFVSAPNLQGNVTAPTTGIVALSYGNLATTDDAGVAWCPTLDEPGAVTGDAIPDEIQPGDVVDIDGVVEKFLITDVAPDACAETAVPATIGQIQINHVCAMTKTGTATPPDPVVVTAEQMASMALQGGTFHDQWGGVKVRLEGVSTSTALDNWGTVVLTGSNLRVTRKLFYRGLQNFDTCHSIPQYASLPVNFTSIEGFHYLDFCSWGISPNDKCADYVPYSDDCTSTTECQPY